MENSLSNDGTTLSGVNDDLWPNLEISVRLSSICSFSLYSHLVHQDVPEYFWFCNFQDHESRGMLWIFHDKIIKRTFLSSCQQF